MIKVPSSRRLAIFMKGNSLANYTLDTAYVGSDRYMIDLSPSIPKRRLVADLLTCTTDCTTGWPRIMFTKPDFAVNVPRNHYRVMTAREVIGRRKSFRLILEAFLARFYSNIQQASLENITKLNERYNRLMERLPEEDRAKVFFKKDPTTNEYVDVVYIKGLPESTEDWYPDYIGGQKGVLDYQPYKGLGGNTLLNNVTTPLVTTVSITPLEIYVRDTHILPAVKAMYNAALNTDLTHGSETREPTLGNLQDFVATMNGVSKDLYGDVLSAISTANQSASNASSALSDVFDFFCAKVPNIDDLINSLTISLVGKWTINFNSSTCIFKDSAVNSLGSFGTNAVNGTLGGATDSTVSGNIITYGQETTQSDTLTKTPPSSNLLPDNDAVTTSYTSNVNNLNSIQDSAEKLQTAEQQIDSFSFNRY